MPLYRIIRRVIASFGDRDTEELFRGSGRLRVLKFAPEVIPSALKKLDMLNAAMGLHVLRALPGNRPERLRGRLRGLWSIRVNRQWRIVFRWAEQSAFDVRLVDYH